MAKTVRVNDTNWTLEKVREEISTNDKAAIKALLRVYKYQTDEEQNAGITMANNGVGFNAFDADFMTSLVFSYQKYGKLTDNQLEVLKKKIKKYGKQIFNWMINEYGTEAVGSTTPPKAKKKESKSMLNVID